ncbi:hypothetical protein YC2023_088708 [Brassica napus]
MQSGIARKHTTLLNPSLEYFPTYVMECTDHLSETDLEDFHRSFFESLLTFNALDDFLEVFWQSFLPCQVEKVGRLPEKSSLENLQKVNCKPYALTIRLPCKSSHLEVVSRKLTESQLQNLCIDHKTSV